MGQWQQPPPERPLWVTFLKYMGVTLGVVFVVAIVFVGFVLFMCTRH